MVVLNKETTQIIELHTASEGGSGTELPVIPIGVEDLDATEVAVRAAGAEVSEQPKNEQDDCDRIYMALLPGGMGPLGAMNSRPRANSWCADWIKAVMSDARRLLVGKGH